MELRDQLVGIANEYQNEFLTIGGFAAYHGISERDAEELIRLAQRTRAAVAWEASAVAARFEGVAAAYRA